MTYRLDALLPPRLTLDALRGEVSASSSAVVWATPSSRSAAERLLGRKAIVGADPDLSGVSLLVAVGGGSALDRAKWLRRQSDQAPAPRLVAMPSIWGSGAEASRIVVLNESQGKRILVGDQWLPDAISWHSTFLETMGEDGIRWACGDTWAHAIEGFLSPLAGADLRAGLAELMLGMLSLGLTRDLRWFEASACACAGQSRAGVGLVHGIAHVLEPNLPLGMASGRWGHARLCAAFLSPVLRFNLARSAKPAELFRSYGIDPERLVALADSLGEPLGPVSDAVRALWPQVLRDPCTRLNSVLVRPGSLEELLGGMTAP